MIVEIKRMRIFFFLLLIDEHVHENVTHSESSSKTQASLSQAEWAQSILSNQEPHIRLLKPSADNHRDQGIPYRVIPD